MFGSQSFHNKDLKIIDGGNDRDFMKRLDALRICFNPENVVILTRKRIPLSVIFVLSLGPKFNFLPRENDFFPLHELNNALDKILDSANQFNQYKALNKQLEDLRVSIFNQFGQNNGEAPSEAQIFIRYHADLAEEFLKKNPDILVMPSDKGGKVLVLEESLYDAKVMEHLDENLKNHVKSWNLGDIRQLIELKMMTLRAKLNQFLEKYYEENEQFSSFPIESEPYIMAKLVVLLKVHKDGMPPRPIISAPEAWGSRLSSWLLHKLSLISKKFGQIEVMNSEDFIHSLDLKSMIPEGHRLANWDYSSMFTNIPFFVAKKIIADNYAVVAEETSVPVDVFLEAIAILVEHSSYFSYKQRIYRQTKGLTMGNRLSKVLAEIVTNFFTMNALQLVDSQKISFISKFVDDFVGAMDISIFHTFESNATGEVKCLEIKRTDENDRGEITFLDVMIIRDGQHGVLTRWWQKECSVRQILNYFSFHPRSMKESVVYEYVRHAFAVTSPFLYQVTIKNLRVTLKRSSYPLSFINEIIGSVLSEFGGIHVTSCVGEVDYDDFDFSSEMISHADDVGDRKIISSSCVSKFGRMKMIEQRPHTRSEATKNKNFISFPFTNENSLTEARLIMKTNNIDLRLAPSMVAPSRRKIFANVKDRNRFEDIRLAAFNMACRNCDFIDVFKTNNLDLARTITHVTLNQYSSVYKHMEKFSGHHVKPGKIIKCRNKFDLLATFNRLKQCRD